MVRPIRRSRSTPWAAGGVRRIHCARGPHRSIPRMHLLAQRQRVLRRLGPGLEDLQHDEQHVVGGHRQHHLHDCPPVRNVGAVAAVPTDNYRARVMIFGGANPATATTEIIEPLAASPAWRNSATVPTPMSQARIQLNATILPSGRDPGNRRVESVMRTSSTQASTPISSIRKSRPSRAVSAGANAYTAALPLQCAAAAGRDRDARRR